MADNTEKKAAFISSIIYIGFSLVLALVFFLSTGGGKYDVVARFGGAAWVFLLTMIISMPVVIPKVKKKYERI